MIKNYNKEYILSILKENEFFYDKISNEHLDNKKLTDNIVYDFTKFTGDTGSVFVDRKDIYLLVDGRYTLQAKNECKNVKIIEVSRDFSENDFLSLKIKNNSTLFLNKRKMSIDEIFNLKKVFKEKKIKIKYLDLSEEDINTDDCFVINNKYVKDKSKIKILKLYNELKNSYNINDFFYVTSDLNEIAVLTNMRKKINSYDDNDIYIKSHLIVFRNKIFLYADIKYDKSILKYLKDNNMVLKRKCDFYNDLKNINLLFGENIKNVVLNFKTNNYYTYECIKNNKNIIVYSDIKSTFTKCYTKKSKNEIKDLYKINIYDSKFLINVIYVLKHFNFDKYKISEYDVKSFLDSIKRSVYYVTTSFDTIVAFGKNSSMPHYSPKKIFSKVIKNDNILLIDIGGHYFCGTTDVTRTISLYKSSKRVPIELKRIYTLVLKSLLKILFQKFKKGTTYDKIDFLARTNMYNEYLDYNHATGHGIGTFSNVHFGNNIYSKNNKDRVIEVDELQSAEPAIYIENKYGVRLEVDTITKSDIKNVFGHFLKFETLTLCPFETDLIDYSMLNSDDKNRLNIYNENIYKTMSKYLSREVKTWLKNVTKKI